jgi:hypothetical protein
VDVDGLERIGKFFRAAEKVGTTSGIRPICFGRSTPPGATPMSQTSPTTADQRLANLKALHQQLEEMAARARGTDQRERRQNLQAPMLVIRGK